VERVDPNAFAPERVEVNALHPIAAGILHFCRPRFGFGIAGPAAARSFPRQPHPKRMNTSIATLLEHKGAAVRSVASTVSVSDAVKEMNRHKIGSVLVMDGTRLAGIFTERDVLTRVVAADLDPKATPISRVMTANVLTVPPETTVQQMMDIFAEKRCRHMPVIKEGNILGIISIGDVSRWAANLHRAEAESLRQYISGGLSA